MDSPAPVAAFAPLAWDALLETASLEDASDRKRRSTVEVPDAVLKLATNARDTRKRITLPYVAAQFDEVSNVFYSAGDLLEPKASVQITRVNKDGKVVKDDTATHVRIFVGNRRGSKVTKDGEGEKLAEPTDDPNA